MDIKLLNKYIAGDVLPEEKKEVIRWMKESEEHREQLMQLVLRQIWWYFFYCE